MKIYALNSSVFDDEKIFNEKYNNASKYRQGKIDSLKQSKDKKLSLAAAVIIDKALSQYSLKEKDMLYAEGENGKPYFENHPDIFFSVSHSGDWAVCAFSHEPVGCDIQIKYNVRLDIAKRFFTENEYNYIISGEDKNDCFFNIWTMKESLVKALAISLPDALGTIDVLNYKKRRFFIYDDIKGYKIAVCSKSRHGGEIIFCEV